MLWRYSTSLLGCGMSNMRVFTNFGGVEKKSSGLKGILLSGVGETLGYRIGRGLIYKIKSSDATNMDNTATTVLGAATSTVAAARAVGGCHFSV